MKKILIADDEESIRYTFCTLLEEAGYEVDSTETLSGCIKKLQTAHYDLLFLDMHIGPENSIEFIRDLKLIQPDCGIIVITGSLDSKAIASSRKQGALDYLVKPIRQPSLLYIAHRSLDKPQAVNL